MFINLKKIRRRRKRPSSRVSKVLRKYRHNRQIEASELRVIDDEGENLGLMSKRKALDLAKSKGMDLIVVSKSPKNTVAKIADWSKFKYNQKKKLKQSKSKSTETKEWWFKPRIQEHDIKIKLRKMQEHLEKGGTAKITVKYIRRTPHNEMKDTMKQILEIAGDSIQKVTEVKKEGRNLAIIVKAAEKN